MRTEPFVIAALLGATKAQQIGKQKQNAHPELSLAKCTSSGCNKTSKSITLDANWRWLHQTGTATNCYTGNSWDKNLCPDPETCASKCGVDGVDTNDWQNTYGVHSTSDQLELGFVTQGQYAKNVGSRTYMMDSSNQYEMFKLKNQEFTFDVDVSNMPCGVNGALYFVEMEADGGAGKYPDNKAGAAYGTGYCDAQCPQDIKFINGQANVLDWINSPTDPNSGTGKWGACCGEMDIWEANSVSSAYTAHPCTSSGHTRCESDQECGTTDRYSSTCDPDGCDLNAYRVGVKDFFGAGAQFKVDTSKPFTVVTQFHTSDKTAAGDLVEIRRLYVQDSKVIEHPKSAVDPMAKQFDSITDEMCEALKETFGD
jgi:cellulose 1,4-beta-cellobiosidase